MIKKSICFVITQGEFGGAQRYVFDLAASLDKSQYEILVLIGEGGGKLKQNLEKANIPVQALSYLKRFSPLLNLLAIFELKKKFESLKPDIVHLNSSMAGFVGSLAAHLAGIQNVIFTAHGFAFLEPNSWIVKKIYFLAEKFATRFRKKIITVSDRDKTSAIAYKLSNPEKFVTIHNGVNLNVANFLSRDEARSFLANSHKLTANSLVVGTIAHDYATKDLPTLRQAFAIVKKDFPNAELVIIGRGGTVGEIEDAAKILPAFDIYVCSSIKEGFPYSILEAAAAGLPIVSTAVGGIPEIISKDINGILVRPRDSHAIADAVKKLIKDPQLAAKLAQNAKQKALEFTLERMVSETEKVYSLFAKH